MPFQNLNEIRKKDEIERVARELEEIVKMPELKDLIFEVTIAECNYPPIRFKGGFQSGIYGKLILTSEGLEDETERTVPKGYESKTQMECYESRRKKVQISDFDGIVDKYKISMRDVHELRSKLEG